MTHRLLLKTPLLAALVIAAVIAGCGGDDANPVAEPAWIELGPDGEITARLITAAASCPQIAIDGRAEPMDVRAEPDPPNFPVLACEAVVPANARRVSLRGMALPLPVSEPRRIAVIGDTGCRLEEGDPPQACDDPTAWPFATVARSVAALEPDLIMHVGDYLYREMPCPDGDAGCAGSPYGYNWDTINADFFTPAASFLRTAPLVLTRGNHELCNRAGPVWFRFLDPRPLDGPCADYTEPYAIPFDGLQLLMLDSAAASDTSIDPVQVDRYRLQFDRLRELAASRAFLLTHRPLWAFRHSGEENGMEVLQRDNATLQAASNNDLPPGVEAVLSGHVHLFEVLSFDVSRPPQVVVGNSGVSLAPAIMTPLTGLSIADAMVSFGDSLDAFGFVTLDRDGPDWRATLRAVDGTALVDCGIANGQLRCD